MSDIKKETKEREQKILAVTDVIWHVFIEHIRVSNPNSILLFLSLSSSRCFFPKPYPRYQLTCCRGQHTFWYFQGLFVGAESPFLCLCGAMALPLGFCRQRRPLPILCRVGVFRALPGNPLFPKVTSHVAYRSPVVGLAVVPIRRLWFDDGLRFGFVVWWLTLIRNDIG